MSETRRRRRAAVRRWQRSIPWEVENAWAEAEYRFREAAMLRRVVVVESVAIVALLAALLWIGGVR